MYATNFEYAGEKLSDYEMIICDFNSSNSIETVSSGADLVFHQARPTGGSKWNLYSATYEDAYGITFQICKDPDKAATQQEMYLDPDLISALQRWLCRDQYYTFKIDDDNYRNIFWRSVFSSKQITLNGEIIGLELTMKTDAPFAYMDEVSVEYECTAGTSFDFYDISEEAGYIYPSLKITILSDGNFSLTNSMDAKIFKIANCSAGEILKIDGDILYITTSVFLTISQRIAIIYSPKFLIPIKTTEILLFRV